MTMVAPPAGRRPGSSPPSVAGVLLAVATLFLLVGALAVRRGLFFGVVVLAAVFVPMERLLALHPQRVLRRGWATDVVHLVVDNLLSFAGIVVAVVVVGLAARAAVPSFVHEAIAGQPGWLQFSEAFLISELAGYAAHRAAHRVGFLWRFHKVHHAIDELDWLAAGHLHPIDQAFHRSCIVLPLFALGFSRATFGAFLVVTTVQAIFIHANVRLRFGALRWLIATPQFHHWHHALDPDARDSNFAGELPVIDWLFGTLHLPADRWPDGYGIDETQPDGYLRQLAWPFRSTAPAGSGQPPPPSSTTARPSEQSGRHAPARPGSSGQPITAARSASCHRAAAQSVDQAAAALAVGARERRLPRADAGRAESRVGSGWPAASPGARHDRSGQPRTGARRRVHTVAPRSSIAWFHAQPCPAGTSASAAPAPRPGARRPAGDAGQHPGGVGVEHADVALEGEGQHRPGGVRPDAGQGEQRVEVVGQRAAVVGHDRRPRQRCRLTARRL